MPYKLFCVEFDTDTEAGTPVAIPDCMSGQLMNNPQLESEITADEIQPKATALVGMSTTGSFDTWAIPSIVDLTGLQPYCIASTSQPGFLMYLQKFGACGTALATSVHRSLLIGSGMLVPKRITCDHRGNARIFYDIAVVKDGANNALVISDTADMPTVTGGGIRWGIDSIKIGNITLSDWTSIEIDLGNSVSTRGSQASVYDQYVESVSHAPVITVTGIDPAWFKESGGVPEAGLACTQANTIIYFSKRDTSGIGYVLDATAEHLKLTAAGMAFVTQVFNGDSQRYGETAIQLKCVEDGSGNDPIVIDTSSAIT